MNLVQVDDNAWLDPTTITSVQYWPKRFDKGLKPRIPGQCDNRQG